MILALVPRDLLHQLPVPKRIRTYLDTPFYYSETIADWTVPGNEPVSSSNLSKDDDDEGESILQTFSNQPPFSSFSAEEHHLLPSNLESETQTDTIQTYQMEQGCNTSSANVVMGNPIIPESSSANVSLHATNAPQSTGSANEESQKLSNPLNENVETNIRVQSPNIPDPPSSPLALATHILDNPHREEQEELVNSENNSVRNNCDAPPSNSNVHSSSSHQQ